MDLPAALSPLALEHLALWVPRAHGEASYGADEEDAGDGPHMAPSSLRALCRPLADALPRLRYLALADAEAPVVLPDTDPYFQEAGLSAPRYSWFRITDREGSVREIEKMWAEDGEREAEDHYLLLRVIHTYQNGEKDPLPLWPLPGSLLGNVTEQAMSS
ncbi:uncharacterized protein BXZ73DRAFT_104536 [Epithele typhae]|uniref:uncharacterized protein n=1 Tax=Epithele typhae TaxID=378194 RepID=UPI002007BBA4|nr:uncharacterized protein BXZ73DRAFT_104536 [Epithele typhae]KAH9921246.1 hypothetical protein BXZ73DRAFT_104536 [Epithele typhae]